jgi:hypothetical protein
MAILSRPLFQYALKAVRHDRLIQLMMGMMVAAAGISLFLGGATILEQQPFSIAMAGTTLRLVAVLGLVIFISFFLRRAFENREIDYLLATPLTRFRLLFSFAVAFAMVAALLTILITLVMFALSMRVNAGMVFWGASVAVELIVTVFMALFFATALKSATVGALCTLGYYTLARMIGMMIGIIQAGLIDGGLSFDVMKIIVRVISVVIPRFDLMSQSSWVVYGTAHDLPLWILPAQLIAFCTLFFICALFDLKRSQF